MNYSKLTNPQNLYIENNIYSTFGISTNLKFLVCIRPLNVFVKSLSVYKMDVI